MIEAIGIPGLSQSVGADIASYKAVEDIAFGAPVYIMPNDADSAYATAQTSDSTPVARVLAGVATLTTAAGKYYSDASSPAPTINPQTGMWNTPVLLSGKGDWVNVLKRGKVLVTAAVAVQANTKAYVTSAAAFSNVAGAGGVQIGYFRSSAAAGELVDLEVSLSVPLA